MTTVQEGDDFATIVELARSRNPVERRNLLDKPNITLAAKLRNTDLKRFVAMEVMLKGWNGLGPWKEAIRKRLATGKKKQTEEEEHERAEERLADAAAQGRPEIAEGNPVEVARQLAAIVLPNVVHVDGGWLIYNGQVYVPMEELGVRAAIQRFVASGVNAETGHPCQPNKRDLDYYADALRNEVFRPALEAKPPTWLDAVEGDPDAKQVISCANGLYDVTSGAMLAHTPRFFTRNGVDFDLDPDPDFFLPPLEWLQFLQSVWPVEEGGKQNWDALQEVMGYLLTGNTEFQKIFVVVGPPRCGKGTLARVITAMLGEANVVNLNVSEFGTPFGNASLIGRQLAIVPDLRLGKDSNIGGITGTLLSVSGEDGVSLNRKHNDYWHGRLNTRVLMLSNMGLILPDQSGALVARLFPLVMHRSFVGREDTELTNKLLGELPSIMAWSLQGLRRLHARIDDRGRKLGFVLTDDGRKMIEDTRRHGSSVQAFLNDCCALAPSATVAKTTLFDAFEGWAIENDVRSYLTPETFTKELKTASGYLIEPSRRRVGGGEQVQYYLGVELKPQYVDHQWPELAY